MGKEEGAGIEKERRVTSNKSICKYKVMVVVVEV